MGKVDYMKHLATYVADCYQKKELLPSTTIECMEYTLKALLNEISKCVLYGAIFSFFHMLPDFLLAYAVFVTLRLFAGGIHCKTYWGCLIVSFIMITTCLLLPRAFPDSRVIMTGLSMISAICPLLWAPVTPSFRMIKKKATG